MSMPERGMRPENIKGGVEGQIVDKIKSALSKLPKDTAQKVALGLLAFLGPMAGKSMAQDMDTIKITKSASHGDTLVREVLGDENIDKLQELGAKTSQTKKSEGPTIVASK